MSPNPEKASMGLGLELELRRFHSLDLSSEEGRTYLKDPRKKNSFYETEKKM